MNTVQQEQGDGRRVVPPVSVGETKTAVILQAEMPGLEKNAISLELVGDELTVTGTTTPDAVPAGFTAVYQERSPAVYRRTFVLGADVARERITAGYDTGILTITLPRAEAAQPRRIEIQG